MTNMGRTDRYLRLAFAVALAVALFMLPIEGNMALQIIMVAVGAVMALSSAAGYCPLYSLIGVKTVKA
jgi:Protein of unknown function (DUF2892).